MKLSLIALLAGLLATGASAWELRQINPINGDTQIIDTNLPYSDCIDILDIEVHRFITKHGMEIFKPHSSRNAVTYTLIQGTMDNAITVGCYL